MEKIQTGAELPQIVIEGYKITVQVSDQPISLTDILDDLLGSHLEKI
ncbi:hypothetical protein [Streptococcus sp. E24BD]